jgi:hypothetical protein
MPAGKAGLNDCMKVNFHHPLVDGYKLNIYNHLSHLFISSYEINHFVKNFPSALKHITVYKFFLIA